MASQRKQILDAVTTALNASTGIVYVSNYRQPWWDLKPNNFPAVCILETDENKKRFAYIHPSAEDMYSELVLTVLGYQFDENNDLSTKRTNLIQDIEYAIQGSTGVKDVTKDIINTKVETDNGLVDNYAIVHCRYVAKYVYNHAAP